MTVYRDLYRTTGHDYRHSQLLGRVGFPETHSSFIFKVLLRTHLSKIVYKTIEVLHNYNFCLKYDVVNNMRIFYIATDIR